VKAIASVSAGFMVAPARDARLHGIPETTVLHADLNLGAAGGIASLGMAFPARSDGPKAAWSIRYALLRTWLLDVGQDKDRTYAGGVADIMVESHPAGKLGIGYFRDRPFETRPGDHVVFLYFEVGL
jgi:hypothetical protein